MVKVIKPKKDFWETKRKSSHLKIDRKINEAGEKPYIVSLRTKKKRERKPKNKLGEIYDWSGLNIGQLHKQGEYFAEIEFTKAKFDVYIPRKRKAIDFIIRKRDGEKYYEVQVSSARENSRNKNYIFYKKDKFKPRKNLLAVLLIFGKKETPSIYLIPSLNWVENKYDFLSDREFGDRKSKPEFGILVDKNSIGMLKEKFAFNKQVTKL